MGAVKGTHRAAQPGQAPVPCIIADKQIAIERLSRDFQASFAYVQNVQGQRWFPSFSVASTVHYLHALWICECKDLLLSVPRITSRYDGRRALELLRSWQEGETADVVAFLEHRLVLASFADITNRMQAAVRSGDKMWLRRLAHGRLVLSNRAWNRERALADIFALSPEMLSHQVSAACAHYGHTVQQIEAQLTYLQTPLYASVRHPALAKHNMVLMNALGVRVANNSADRPGLRTSRVQAPTLLHQPYAEQVVGGVTTLVSRWSNNPALVCLDASLEQEDAATTSLTAG
jgi:hypothetical protein